MRLFLFLCACGFSEVEPPADLPPADLAVESVVDLAGDLAEGCAFGCTTSTATQRDIDSHRGVAINCPRTTTLCDYSQTCQLGASSADCVSCGAEGNRIGYRSIDGTVKEDCLGCACSAWSLFGCYNETTSYGAPWADVVWQVGTSVLRFAVTSDGRVIVTGKALADTITSSSSKLWSFDFTSSVDVELTLTNSTSDGHSWDMHGRVVGNCP